MFNLKIKVMKTAIGIGLIILGIISMASFPNFGVSFPETIGVIIGVGLLTFLPGILLIRSDLNAKTK